MTQDQPTTVPPGWYPDPHGVAELRWWDGSAWTDNIHNAVVTSEPQPVPGRIEDEGGAAVFDLDYVPESSNAQASRQDTAAAGGNDSPMHELFSTELRSRESEQPDTARSPGVAEQPAVSTAPSSSTPQATEPETFEPLQAEPLQAEPLLPEPQVAEPQVAEPQVPVVSLPVTPATGLPVPSSADDLPDAGDLTGADDLPDAGDLTGADDLPAAGADGGVVAAAATPAAQSVDPGQLPSRREMRRRAQEEEARGTTEAQDVQPTPAVATPAVATPPAAAASAPVTPADAFDTSVPTSFNWAVDAPVAPSVPETTESAAPAPTQEAPTSEPLAEASTPEQPAFDFSAFPPPSAPDTAAEPSGVNALGLGAAPIATPAPVASEDPAWVRDEPAFAVADRTSSPSSLPSSTVSSWLIACLPLIAAVLSIGAVEGAKNYPRYAPAGAEGWMLVGGVLGVLYLVTLLFAIADRRKLDGWGHSFPAHWAWAFATAPAYLIARTVEVKRQTGRVTPQLWVWILLSLVVVGGYFATAALAPALIANYTIPTL